MTYVSGVGPSTASLIVVGEAPGEHEERELKPFVGPSGRIVNEVLNDAGISRSEVYLTNVVKVRPPNNDIKKLNLLGKSIDDFIPQLWDEINAIKPNAILAFGNTALTALTNHKGIEKYRGSSQGYPKVIPTLHPASLLHKESSGKLRSWKDIVFIKWDAARAVNQSKFKEIELPRRNLMVCRNSLDLFRFLDKYNGRSPVSVDIETFRTIPICIAFAFNSSEALSIPLFNILSPTNESGISRSDMTMIWKAIAEILFDPHIQKIGQNFKFDESLLETCVNKTVNFGMKVYGFYFDTMLAFKTLYPELPAKLEFISSVLTEEPYYKDEGKEFNPKKDKLDRLLLYNAKDAAVTYEV